MAEPSNGAGVNEQGIDTKSAGPFVHDPVYFCSTDVDFLIGDVSRREREARAYEAFLNESKQAAK